MRRIFKIATKLSRTNVHFFQFYSCTESLLCIIFFYCDCIVSRYLDNRCHLYFKVTAALNCRLTTAAINQNAVKLKIFFALSEQEHCKRSGNKHTENNRGECLAGLNKAATLSYIGNNRLIGC